MKGLGVSPGKVVGPIKIIRNFDDHSNFRNGDVLVTKITNPTMVTLMGKASAIICEIGGLTSHPSIISRELGVPCIVQVDNAMQKLENGDIVEVNGSNGFITIYKKTKVKLKW